jgi:hypothetical protein
MRYPLNDDTDQYEGKIIFLPIVEKYIDAAKTAQDVVAVTRNSVGQFDEGAAGKQDAGFDPRGKDQRNTPVRDDSPRRVLAPRTTYGRSGSGAVTLYLPQAITIQDGVQHDTLNLGIIGAGALAGLEAGEGITASAFASLEEAGKSALDLITDRRGMGSTMAGLAAVRLAQRGGQKTRGVIGSAFGIAVNPNTRALFKSVNLREFSFTFKMIASSQSEAIAIEQIIKTFRTELYPESIKVGDVSMGYYYPNKFKILMSYKNQKVGTKFLPSNLKAVNVVYNPSSMGWHADGKPSEVDLTLSFGEPRTLDAQDVKDGY